MCFLESRFIVRFGGELREGLGELLIGFTSGF